MSMVRIVTRITPSNAPEESLSHLLAANQIDTPVRTYWSSSGEHGTGNAVTTETTYCKEDVIPPNLDLDSAIASKCNEISGLVCLKKSRLRLTTESSAKSSRELYRAPVIKVTPEMLADGSCSGILLSIPLRIPRSEIPTSSISSTFGPVETEEHCLHSDYSLSMEQRPNQNFSISTLCSTNGETEQPYFNSKSDYSTLKEAVGPLRKYFKGNKCLLCGFVSSNKWGYTAMRHLATHLKTQSFKCNQCDKLFHSLLHFQYHKESHKAEFKFTCDQCGKKFKGKRRLVMHLKSHENEGVKCPFCESRFKTNKFLKKHMTVHADELPYQCSLCREKFRTADILQNHSLQHTKEKRFKCDVCGKGYRKKTMLEAHRNVHNK